MVFFRAFAVASLIAASSMAQGGSAVITLVMPPPGGDGHSALQAGAAIPTGATGLYYNPALLADLQRATGSQLFYTNSEQSLIPVLQLNDLYQVFEGWSAVIPDTSSGYDLGVGFFRNRVNFGESTAIDESGNTIGTLDSYETVYGLGLSARLGMPISVGATAKYYASHLAHAFGDSRAAYGWAFDAGILVNPRIAPAKRLRLPAFSLTPSMAFVVRNLGPSIHYGNPEEADPIPTTYVSAFALGIEAMDLIEIQGGMDFEQEWTRRSENLATVRMAGYSGLFLVFRFGESWLDDPAGERWERHFSHSVDLNFLRLHRLMRRVIRDDIRSPSRELDSGYFFPSGRIFGMPYRCNPRFAMGFRSIDSRDGGIRDGQKAYFLSLSL